MERQKRFAVIGSDARQLAAGRALARAGYAVEGPEEIALADYILLPLPLDAARTPLAELLRAARPGALALGGMLSEEAKAIAAEAGVELVDYFAREELAIRNATPGLEESRGLGFSLYDGRPLSCGDLFSPGACGHTGFTGTSNGPVFGGENTYGGYSQRVVVKESFVLSIAHDEKSLAAVAPLLCAGITTYSPLKHWGVGPGMKVGVVGLGGLGHMAVKIAHAMGAKVVLFTTSAGKVADAKRLGADEVCISTEKDQMGRYANQLDFILDTVAAPHQLDAYLQLLKKDATMTLVGAPADPHPSSEVFNLIFKRRQLAGSLIGGIAETQEMLDFCAHPGIVSEIELIPMDYINDAYERMLKSDVKYRFVIDMASLI